MRNMQKILAKLLLGALFFSGLLGCSGQDKLPQNKETTNNYEALASSYQEITNFGENPGRLKMYLYTPSEVRSFAPVVFVLHGCGGTAAWMKQYAGFDKVAETEKVYVAYVEKTGTMQNCFAWNTVEGRKADTSSIAQMAAHLKNIRSIDGSQVYIAGLSAGGAMANAALALYPRVFAAGALVAGLPYGASSQIGIPELPAIDCQGTCPRVMVYQGTDDNLVAAANAQKIISQWAAAHGISAVPASLGTLNNSNKHEYKSYQNSDKKELLSLVMLEGFGHAWPVDPNGTGPKPDAGGALDPDGYAVDGDVNAAFYSYEFFKAGRIVGDTVPPQIKLVEMMPTCSQALDPACAINPDSHYYQFKASDNKALKKVEIWLDGQLVKTFEANGSITLESDFFLNFPLPDSGKVSVTARAIDMAALEAKDEISYGYKIPNLKLDLNNGELCLISDLTLDKVEFFKDGMKIGEDNTAPYCFSIDESHLTQSATFVARAFVDGRSYDASYSYTPFPCSQWDKTVYEHVQAGRAETYTKWYVTYAKLIGSGEELGQVGNAWFSTKKVVKEEKAGFFQLGSCSTTTPVGSEPQDFISMGDASEGIAFDGKGNLFVTSYEKRKIIKYNAVTKETTNFVENVSGPSAMDFDPDGNLWVALNAGKAVHQYDASGNLLKAFTGTGAIFGGAFQGPNGLRVSKKGIVYFTDATAKKLYRIKNGEVKLIYTESSFTKSPNGVVLNQQEDTLYVLATEMSGYGKLGSITAVSLDGNGEYVSKKTLTLSQSMPVLDGGVFGRDGHLYASYNKKDIARVNVETGAVDVIYTSKSIGDKLCWPAEIAFGQGDGFNPDFLYITQIGTATALGETVTEGNQKIKTLKIF